MNFEGTMLVYADQATAEKRVAELRAGYIELIERLEALNESIDSFKLSRLIADEQFKLGI